jgi:hypothetical protein
MRRFFRGLNAMDELSCPISLNVTARAGRNANVARELTEHGLGSSEFHQILEADPFWQQGTAASIDTARFKSIATTFPYERPYSATDMAMTSTFSVTNESMNTNTRSIDQSYGVGLSIEGGFAFTKSLKASLKDESTWTWTDSTETAGSSDTTQTATVSVGGPSFGYTGSTSDIAVYYDSLFKTFMFAPVLDTGVSVGGLVVEAGSKQGAAWH